MIDRVTNIDRLHDDADLELGAEDAGLAYRCKTPFQVQYTGSKINDRTSAGTQTSLRP